MTAFQPRDERFWQKIQEESHSLEVSMSSRLQAAKEPQHSINCLIYTDIYLPNYIWVPENGGQCIETGSNFSKVSAIFLFNPSN